MFDFLKKKIGAFFGKSEEKTEIADVGEKKESKSAKKDKKIKDEAKEKKSIEIKADKKQKELDKVTKKEKEAEEKTEVEKEEVKGEIKEEKIEEKTEEEVEEGKKGTDEKKEGEKEEKKGFFKRLFGKKEEIKEEAKKVTEEKKEGEKEEVKGEIKEEKIEEAPKEEGFFSKLIKKVSQSNLTKEQFDELFGEFEITLLENNVALEAVDKIRESLSKSLIGQTIRKEDVEKRVLQALKDSILSVLIEGDDLIGQIKKKEGIFVLLFFGINGTGKTTTIAKIANLLKSKGISCVLAAADTFRAASIEQLKLHGDRLDVPVVSGNYGADPASIAFDARKYAEKHKIKVVLIDTAGRMYTKENLLKEMDKIIRVSKPDLKFFVGESITGNDSVEQAKTFNESAGIDGIILSKADVDEKAGAILSVSQVTGKPIYFLGIGQGYEDLLVFSKKEVLKNLGLE